MKMLMKVLFCKPLVPVCVPFVAAMLSVVNGTNHFIHEIGEVSVIFSMLLFLNYHIIKEETEAQACGNKA